MRLQIDCRGTQVGEARVIESQGRMLGAWPSAGGGLRFDAAAVLSAPTDSPFRLDSAESFERFVEDTLGHTGMYREAMRQDAGLTMAFARQLEHIMAKVYEARYWQYRAREFFPVNSEVDPGALTYTYRMTQREGVAAIINAGNSKDLPNADVSAEEFQQPIITIGSSYNFNVINQLSGAMANIPIEALKAAAARKAIEALEETIFCVGSANAGVAGVCNVPGIVGTTKTSTGTWVAQYLANATTSALTSTLVPAIASDINAAVAQVISQSYGQFEPTDCLLPVNLWTLLKVIPQSTILNSKSLLTFLEEMTGLHFDYWPALGTAGASAGSPAKIAAISGGNPALSGRILVYDRDPEVMQLVQAQPFTQLAPQPTGMVFEVPAYSRIGGAYSPQPLGITYVDGC